jgi:phospholipid/cholesterol/gamma-HCH transport system substrate-binding protein
MQKNDRNKYVGLGIFVFLGLLLFALGLFLIGNRRMLFEDSFEIWTEFSKITGLQNGAIVRVSGKDSGEVKDIEVPRSPAGKFRIRVRIVEEVHPLVRTDSVASIQTDGLVGNKFLSITVGSTEAPIARPGSTIPGSEPFEFADLLQEASETMHIANETVKSLRDDIEKTLKAASNTIEEIQVITKATGADIKGVTSASNRIAQDLSEIVSGVKQGKGTIGKIIADDSIYKSADAMAQDAARTAQNIREASEKAHQILDEFQQKTSKGLTAEAQGTIRNLNEVLTDMADNAEALKRNFFFRGFFKNRGYYDLDNITVSEYKKGLLTKTRYEKKVWLSFEEIFERNESEEFLSEQGKALVVDTMKELLRYQADPVFFVEGYSSEGTSGDQHLRSRQRAAMIKNYVLSQFPIPSEVIGVMPLGLKINQLTSEKFDGVSMVVYYLPLESS